jgi:ribonuclease HII
MHGLEVICGLDEAGRGPLAGPVYAAAVILDVSRPISGLADSKALTAQQRERLASEIRSRAIAWAIASASVVEIDELNILHASMLAMSRAARLLKPRPTKALVDGNRCPELDCAAEAVIGGDASIPCISAASILAKVARDAEMLRLHALYPEYGLDRHKGYPTRQHLAALEMHGIRDIHRKTFAPVRRLLPGHSVT